MFTLAVFHWTYSYLTAGSGVRAGLSSRSEEFPPAGVDLLHLPGVEFLKQLTDRPIQLRQARGGAIPKPCQDPPLHYEDGGLDPRFAGPGRDDREPITVGNLGELPVQVRLIPVRHDLRAFGVVGDDYLGHSAYVLQRSDMGRRPTRKVHGEYPLVKGVAACAKCSYEDVCRDSLSGIGVHDGNGIAGIIGERLLPPVR